MLDFLHAVVVVRGKLVLQKMFFQTLFSQKERVQLMVLPNCVS